MLKGRHVAAKLRIFYKYWSLVYICHLDGTVHLYKHCPLLRYPSTVSKGDASERNKLFFYICSSMHCKSSLKKSNKMQQDADIYLLLNYSTCFGRPSCLSSGVHKSVVAASGTGHTVWEASFFKRDQIRTYYLVTFEEACSPDSMTCTRGCNCGFLYSWWWARWTPETCRVI